MPLQGITSTLPRVFAHRSSHPLVFRGLALYVGSVCPSIDQQRPVLFPVAQFQLRDPGPVRVFVDRFRRVVHRVVDAHHRAAHG